MARRGADPEVEMLGVVPGAAESGEVGIAAGAAADVGVVDEEEVREAARCRSSLSIFWGCESLEFVSSFFLWVGASGDISSASGFQQCCCCHGATRFDVHRMSSCMVCEFGARWQAVRKTEVRLPL